jgi:predicted ThiF/HesA family dinucleotide-utilizing enzyme
MDLQAAGTADLSNASFVATYDLSCPTSPYGSVHNVEKGPIGDRVAAKIMQLHRGAMGASAMVTDGPHATAARVVSDSGDGVYDVEVQFAGGSAPFTVRATKNCTSCCGLSRYSPLYH